MAVLHRASTGYLLRHPWQLGLALAGICVGVAVMVAVDLANRSSQKAFELSMHMVNGRATHQIVGGPGGLDEVVYVDLRVTHSYRRVAPLVTGFVTLGEHSLQLLGVDVFAEREVRRFTREAAAPGGGLPVRALLTMPGALLMSRGRAAQSGLAVGDTVEVEVSGRHHTATLVGLLERGPPGTMLDEFLVTDIATAQHWFERKGRLTRIDVVIPDDGERVLRDRLPAGAQLLPTTRRSRAVTEMSDAFSTNLTAMSGLAMLVGVFLIYNSVSFAVLQRRSLFGILRALGVTAGQALGLILREALLLGAAGAVLGIGLGLWLGEQLLGLVSQSINDLYFRVSVSDLAIDPWSIGRGLAAGVIATLVAAAVPAVEAATTPPRLTLARSTLEARAGRASRALSLAGLVMLVIAGLILWLSDASLVAGLLALFLLVLGTALWIPPLVLSVTALVAPLVMRLGGSVARLAIVAVAASLSRTGVAIVALAVAVSATIGVSVMVDSFRSSVSDWVERSLQSDFYIAVADGGPLDKELVEDLVRVPGIAHYSSSRRVWLESDAGLTRLVALRMAPGSAAGIELIEGSPEAAWPAFENRAAVLVSETLAYRRKLAPGDTVQLMTARGQRAFPIAATYRSYDANAGAVLMNRTLYDTFWDDDAIDSLGIYLQNGADAGHVMERLEATARGRQAIALRSHRELRDTSLRIFDRTFIITDVLYWLAVGVAVVGILGAMLALQLERAREFGVLRAVGMTPAQVGTMVTLQSGFMGVLGGLASMPLGLLMAWVLVEIINRRAFGWTMQFSVDPAVLYQALGLSIGAALVAGLYPARQVARQRPARAMRED